MQKQKYTISCSTRGSVCVDIEATSPKKAMEIFLSDEFIKENELYGLDGESTIEDEEGNYYDEESSYHYG